MNKTETNRSRLLEAPVGMTLAGLTVPMVFGILSMVLYHLADTFFVGKLGKEQLAALSFTFPVVMVIAGLAQGIGMGVFFVHLLLAGKIAALFNQDPVVVSTAGLYLRIVSLSFAAQGFYLVVSAGLNVLKRPFHATGLSILELFGLAIPLALLGSRLIGITGIFGAIGISYLITGGVAWIVIERVLAPYRLGGS